MLLLQLILSSFFVGRFSEKQDPRSYPGTIVVKDWAILAWYSHIWHKTLLRLLRFSALFIIYAGLCRLSSKYFRKSRFKEKTARSGHVFRKSFRFLWLRLQIATILDVWYGRKQREEKFLWSFINNFHFLKNSFSFKTVQTKLLWQTFTPSLIKLKFIFFFLTWFDKTLYSFVCYQESINWSNCCLKK